MQRDPMTRTGRRAKLGSVLERILGCKGIEVEFLSSMKRHDDDGCLVYGVFRGDSAMKFPTFRNTTSCFREAVIEAFGYDDDYNAWTFEVAVAQDSYAVVDKLSRFEPDRKS